MILLLTILGPFFQVVYGALFPQVSGFSVEPVYTVFLATPEYLLVFWRTLALCALIVVSQVVLSVLAGLGFAKYNFPGKGLCFFLLLVVMVLPLQVTLVPNFRILGTLGPAGYPVGACLASDVRPFGHLPDDPELPGGAR